MRKPVSRDTKARLYCRNFVAFANHWFISSFVRPIFFLLPPSILTWAATRSGIRTDLESLLGPKVGALLSQSGLLILVVAYLYVAIMKSIFSGIEHYSRPEKEVGRDEVNAILRSVNVVVGDKMKRFSVQAKSVLDKPHIDARTIFENITQPTQQIGLLVSALRGAFEFIDQSGALFRVGLLIITDGSPTEWAHFDPAERPPRTPANDLGHPGSTVMHAIRAKAPVVVEDIAKELNKKTKDKRRYLKCNTREGEDGAQLCYPIIHPATGRVEYVITIAGDKKCCLLERHLALYEWIIEHYALRIALEHSLLILKGKSREPVEQAA